MKKIILIVLILVVGSSLYANGNKEKVLLFIRHGRSTNIDFAFQKEFSVMTSMLEEAGLKVIVATGSGEPIKNLSQTSILIRPDLKLADVRVEDYLGIIMPCMMTGYEGWKAYPEEIWLVKEAVAQGKPIAAQRDAIIILGESGVIEFKKYAGEFDQSFRFIGGIYSGKGVIRDGDIITSSNSPWSAWRYGEGDGTRELTRLFIEAIKE